MTAVDQGEPVYDDIRGSVFPQVDLSNTLLVENEN
jgi:hypothetical protein